MNGFVNGLFAPPVMKLYPAYADVYFDTPGAQTFVVPRGAKRIDVTCIGGGGAGGETGYNYGQGGIPGTGGDGGTGEMQHLIGCAVTPGETYLLTVGAGGTRSQAAGASSFSSLLSARGGQNGATGAYSDLSNNTYAVVAGGNGGAGGIGGRAGDSGINRSGKDWGGGDGGADWHAWSGWTSAQWYCFGDAATQRRLGTAGADYTHLGYAPRGRTDLPGTAYGSGGQGTKKNAAIARTDGGDGLVAIRIYYR